MKVNTKTYDLKSQALKVMSLRKEGVDTLPKFLLLNYERHGTVVAMRHKKFGIWNEYTWDDCYRYTKDFALGLVSLGLQRGDKVCIIGDNEPESYWAELAVQALGGISIGLYVDVIASELEYFVTHSGSKFAVASDQEQVDKFLEIEKQIPGMQKVIYWDPKGMWAYKNNPFIIHSQDVKELGSDYEKGHPGFFEESIGKGNKSDIAIFSYTSGTTGTHPKAAMLSHDYMIKGCVLYSTGQPQYENDNYLSFLSPAWVAEQMYGLTFWLLVRTVVNFVEEPELMRDNMREIAPQMLLLGTRLWEDMLSSVQMKINDANPLFRLIYNICLPVGYRLADYRIKEYRQPPIFWKILYQLVNWICFRPIRDQLGLEYTRIAAPGGALLGPETFRFYIAIGVKLKVSYGLTEMVTVSLHLDTVRPDSAGPPCLGTDVRISEEGEVLARCDGAFSGYYMAPEVTSQMWDNGWLKTGDAGFVDFADGHLIILGRVKELVELQDGSKYSSAYIENSLKFSPFIKDAIVVGGKKRAYIICMINIDFDNVGRWAERNKITYTTYADLSQKSEVYNIILKEVQRVNRALPPSARVKKYLLLYKELDPDEGELTRTRKLRRNNLEMRYSNLIEAAYAGQSTALAETEVKYRDGRTGKITIPVTLKAVV